MPRIPSSLSHSGLILVPKRSFFLERRLTKLESEADETDSTIDPRKQASYYKELLSNGNYSQLIHRFETQPQLPPVSMRYPEEQRVKDIYKIQSDKECLKYYITALTKDGKTDRLATQMATLMGGSNGGMAERASTLKPHIVGEPKEYTIRTDLKELPPSLASYVGSSTRSSRPLRRTQAASVDSSEPKQEPVQIVISESWSWSKFARKAGIRIVSIVLMVTGLSVLFDQQGVIKTGNYTFLLENF